jgi:hypothetical protein
MNVSIDGFWKQGRHHVEHVQILGSKADIGQAEADFDFGEGRRRSMQGRSLIFGPLQVEWSVIERSTGKNGRVYIS